MQAYTFVLKYKKDVRNKVVDALSRRVLSIHEIKLKSVGMSDTKDINKKKKDSKDVYEECEKLKQGFRVEFTNYML